MKILIVTPIFPPENRGPATYCFNLCQEIPSIVITFTKNPITAKSVEVISIPTKGGVFIRQIRLIKQICQQGKSCDLIYAQGADVCGFAAVIAGKLINKKVVVKFVGDLDEEMRRDFNKNVNYLKYVIKLTLKFADKIIFPAEHLRKQIVSKYEIDKNRTEVVYNAI